MSTPTETVHGSTGQLANTLENPEVARLQSQINKLKKTENHLRSEEDKWNNRSAKLTIAGVITTGLFAFAVWFSSREATGASIAARPAAEQLEIKEARIRSILDTEADAKIAVAQREGATANQQAQQAISGAEQARRETALARVEAARIGERALVLEHETEELRTKNLAVQSALEEERLRRVQLAASLSARTFQDQSGAIQRLSSFQPMPVIFEYPDQPEPTKTAQQIAFVFRELNWPISRHRVDSMMIRPGISVKAGVLFQGDANPEAIRKRATQVRIGDNVAETVSEILAGSGLVLNEAFPDDTGLYPPGVLIISVGEKPNPEAEKALEQLGVPEATVAKLPNGGSFAAKGNSVAIPDELEPIPARNKSRP